MRCVPEVSGQEFARNLHAVLHKETSAKTGANIKTAMDACVAVIEKNVGAGVYEVAPNSDNVDFRQEEPQKGCSC